VAETLRALRAAGYTPVAETADAAPVIERAARHRAVPVDGGPIRAPRRPLEAVRDPVDTAAAILAGRPTETEDGAGTAAQLRTAAPHLTPGELRLLAHAIDEDTPVHIEYVNAQGRPSSRVIEEISSDGHMLYAWCTLRDDERMFALSRISSVAPA
jgi:predicted DNA-binding transcriptional regulator YafY